jgi:hypothetical protein
MAGYISLYNELMQLQQPNQLTLYESLVLGFAGSDALQKKTPKEQRKVMNYLGSGNFKQYVDDLEKSIQKSLSNLMKII